MEITRTRNVRNSKTSSGYELTDLARIPPQSLEFEEAVLGALMLEKQAIEQIIDVLKPDHFYSDQHQKIYQAIVSLFEKTQPIDLITVGNRLKEMAEYDLVGGAYYLTRLTSRVSSAANIEFHARIIVEKAIKREIIRIAGEAQRDAFDNTQDVFELLDKTETDLFQVRDSNIRRNYMDMNSVLRQALEELEARKDIKDGTTGVPSGFSALDRVTAGWQKQSLVILAARPGMGKTAFVVSCARNAAVQFKKGVAIFSLEMSSVELVNRIICAEAEIDAEKIKKGQLSDNEWSQLHRGVNKLEDAPLFIDDTPALSVLELRAKCRRLKAQHNIQLIVIDYLQLMTGDTMKVGANREQEIASISRSLKNLAKELDVPVIALSQLSRAVETRGTSKKPQLSDLRESGSLEQDADMVIFLYRPEYYQITTGENGEDLTGVGEVIIAKHRNGSLDTVQLRFVGRYTKFKDLDGGFGEGMGAGDFYAPLPSVGGADNFDLGGSNTITLGSKLNDMPPPMDFDDSVPF